MGSLKIRLEDQDRRGKPSKGKFSNDYAVMAKNAAHGWSSAPALSREGAKVAESKIAVLHQSQLKRIAPASLNETEE
jgi:hypothetical protein